jgi:hypothetical protein
MKRQVCVLVAVCSVLVTLTGCGAIFNGTRQTIQANSAPSAATIEVSPTDEEYTTPASMSLERKSNYVLTFSKEGYTSAKFNIQRKLSGGILVLDVLFTGLLGVIVDAATGAWYNLSPEVATVSLERLGAIDGPQQIHLRIRSKGDKLHIESDEPGVSVRVEQTQ